MYSPLSDWKELPTLNIRLRIIQNMILQNITDSRNNIVKYQKVLLYNRTILLQGVFYIKKLLPINLLLTNNYYSYININPFVNT